MQFKIEHLIAALILRYRNWQRGFAPGQLTMRTAIKGQQPNTAWRWKGELALRALGSSNAIHDL